MKIWSGGSEIEVTDCRFLDVHHQDDTGRCHCNRNGKYVRAVISSSRPDGCRCVDFILAIPEKEISFGLIDSARRDISEASMMIIYGHFGKAKELAKKSAVAVIKAIKMIDAMLVLGEDELKPYVLDDPES